MKREAIDQEKIFVKCTSVKELVPKIYRENLKLNNKNTNNSVKKQTKDLNRHFTKEDMKQKINTGKYG